MKNLLYTIHINGDKSFEIYSTDYFSTFEEAKKFIKSLDTYFFDTLVIDRYLTKKDRVAFVEIIRLVENEHGDIVHDDGIDRTYFYRFNGEWLPDPTIGGRKLNDMFRHHVVPWLEFCESFDSDEFFEQVLTYENFSTPEGSGIFFSFFDVGLSGLSVFIPHDPDTIEEYRKKFYPDDTQDLMEFYADHDHKINEILVDKFIKGELKTINGYAFSDFAEAYRYEKYEY